MSFPAAEAEPTVVLPTRGMPVHAARSEAVEPPPPPLDEEPEAGPARLFIGPPRATSPRGVSAGIEAAPDTGASEAGPPGDWEERLRWSGLDRSARTVAEDREGQAERMRPRGAIPEAARRAVMGQASPRPADDTAVRAGDPDDGHAVSPFLAQNPAEAARMRQAAGAARVAAAAAPAPAPTPPPAPPKEEAPAAAPARPGRSLAELRGATVGVPPAREPAPAPAAAAPPPLPPSRGAASRLRQRGQLAPDAGVSDVSADEHLGGARLELPPRPAVPPAPATAPAAAAPSPTRAPAPFIPRNQRPPESRPPRVSATVWAVTGIGLMVFSAGFIWWRIRGQVRSAEPAAEQEAALPPEVPPAAPEPVAIAAPVEPPVAPDPVVEPEVVPVPAPVVVVAPPVAPTAIVPAPKPPEVVVVVPPPVAKPPPEPLVMTVPAPKPPAPAPVEPARVPATPVPAAPTILTPGAAQSSPAEAAGLLRITTNPPARVQIDGKAMGTIAEQGEFSLSGGEHRVRVVSTTNGKSQTMLVRIDPGRSTAISFQLK